MSLVKNDISGSLAGMLTKLSPVREALKRSRGDGCSSETPQCVDGTSLAQKRILIDNKTGEGTAKKFALDVNAQHGSSLSSLCTEVARRILPASEIQVVLKLYDEDFKELLDVTDVTDLTNLGRYEAHCLSPSAAS